jgi:hypothetical protein
MQKSFLDVDVGRAEPLLIAKSAVAVAHVVPLPLCERIAVVYGWESFRGPATILHSWAIVARRSRCARHMPSDESWFCRTEVGGQVTPHCYRTWFWPLTDTVLGLFLGGWSSDRNESTGG